MARLNEHPGLVDLPTPAVFVLADRVDANIDHAVGLLGGPDRIRPHVKTARTAWAIGRMRQAGIHKVKASTVAEAELAVSVGMPDVLLAYPAVGPQLDAMGELASAHQDSSIAVLVDDPSVVQDWPTTRLSAFVDLDTGLGRTGVPVHDRMRLDAVLAALSSSGIVLRGIHAYDGHLAGPTSVEQVREVRQALQPVPALARRLDAAEVVVGGSHTFLPGVAFLDDAGLGRIVTGSPGTVVYCDGRSLSRFGPDGGFRPAAFVLSRVVSISAPGSFTLDAGLTAIQSDAGHPHFAVVDRPDIAVGEPAQEHTAVSCPAGLEPALGTVLALMPYHIDTAIAQFAEVLVWDGGPTPRHERVNVRHGAQTGIGSWGRSSVSTSEVRDAQLP